MILVGTESEWLEAFGIWQIHTLLYLPVTLGIPRQQGWHPGYSGTCKWQKSFLALHLSSLCSGQRRLSPWEEPVIVGGWASLGLLGDQSHIVGTAPVSLPAACQKSLTGCQQLCCSPFTWMVPFECTVVSVWVIFSWFLTNILYWSPLSCPLKKQKYSLLPCCLTHTLSKYSACNLTFGIDFLFQPIFNEV